LATYIGGPDGVGSAARSQPTESRALPEFQIPAPRRAFDAVMGDGAVIRVRAHGDPEGLRLVLSHGNGLAIDAYFPFWRLLLERFEVVVFDFRNHGQNPFHRAEAHNYTNFLADLPLIRDAIVSELGEKPTIGAFHSLSARANLKRAMVDGWLWDAMALFDPPMAPPPGHRLHERVTVEERALIKWARARRERYSDPAEFADELEKSRVMRHWTDGSHAPGARAMLRRDDDRGDWALCCPGALEASIYGENTKLDLWPRAEEFARPLRIICGDPDFEDTQSPAFCGRALAEESGYDYAFIPGTGHFLQIEKPEECARALVDFIDATGFGG